MSIHEYSGLASSKVLDTAASFDYSGDAVGAMQTSAIIPTTSGDLIFGGLVEVSSGIGDSCSASGVFTSRVNQCDVDGFIAEDYVEPIASAISASATLTPTSGHYVAGIAAFRAVSSPTSAGPTVPMNLAVSGVTTSSISLTWTASTDSAGVTGYQVFRNGTQFAVTTTPQYTDDGLTPSTTYTYAVDAFDAAGNVSALSASVSATTVSLPVTTPPSVPTNLTATAVTSSSVSLAWTASTDSAGVAGYNVFRNSAQVGTTTGVSYTDTGLSASTSYTYAVDAYDAAGNVSALSSSISATTAAPASGQPVYPLQISSNGRYLVDQNNHPFYITGEQAWSLITELSNSDVNVYLSDRASRGYNALWLAAADNTYQSDPPYDYYGDAPFDGPDFTNEDATYWSHVDYVIQQAGNYGMTVMIDPAFVGLNSSRRIFAELPK